MQTMKKNRLMGECIAEAFGTLLLILLGDGVVADVVLAPRGDYNWNTIAIGWAFAVIIAVYITGGVTGAHLNPAVTLALAVKRGFPWAKVIPYWIAQFVGAFLGALGVFLCYRDGLIVAGMPNVWTSGPGVVEGASFSLATAFICEIFGTAVLLGAILASGDSNNLGLSNNLGVFVVGGVILAVGLSLGGPSGYSLNPARDLSPRIFGALVGTRGLFDGLYWLLPPVTAPLIGGIVGVFAYDWFVTPFLSSRE
jgi:glycerol uptake facilitator protein